MTTVDYILMGVVGLFALLDVFLTVKSFRVTEESQNVESVKERIESLETLQPTENISSEDNKTN